MTNNQPTDVKIALLIERQESLQRQLESVEERAEKEIAAVNIKLSALQCERDQWLKWGVMTLGAAVVGMVVWIANKLVGGQIH